MSFQQPIPVVKKEGAHSFSVRLIESKVAIPPPVARVMQELSRDFWSQQGVAMLDAMQRCGGSWLFLANFKDDRGLGEFSRFVFEACYAAVLLARACLRFRLVCEAQLEAGHRPINEPDIPAVVTPSDDALRALVTNISKRAIVIFGGPCRKSVAHIISAMTGADYHTCYKMARRRASSNDQGPHATSSS
jgi:hypothetical protein